MKRILLINVLSMLMLGVGIGIGGQLIAGITHAQEENSDVILACVDSLTGTVRIVESQNECKPAEMSTQWNIQGSQGLQGLQGEPGPQGLQGEQGVTGSTGPQGEQGITGAKGETGAPGLIGYEIVSEVVEMSTNSTMMPVDYDDQAIVECPSGKSVIGGGFVADEPNDVVEVVKSIPSYNSWIVGVNTTQQITMTIYAICAYVED